MEKIMYLIDGHHNHTDDIAARDTFRRQLIDELSSRATVRILCS